MTFSDLLHVATAKDWGVQIHLRLHVMTMKMKMMTMKMKMMTTMVEQPDNLHDGDQQCCCYYINNFCLVNTFYTGLRVA